MSQPDRISAARCVTSYSMPSITYIGWFSMVGLERIHFLKFSDDITSLAPVQEWFISVLSALIRPTRLTTVTRDPDSLITTHNPGLDSSNLQDLPGWWIFLHWQPVIRTSGGRVCRGPASLFRPSIWAQKVIEKENSLAS